jgi:dUTP pyrophosphatase
MDKDQIEEYIKKLTLIEKELTDEDSIDFEYAKDLDNLLNVLRNDAIASRSGEFINTLSIKIKKLHPNAVIPTYSKEGDAGMDLVATEILNETTEQVNYGTGIALEIPYGYVGLVFPRSSIRKYDLSLTNCVGVIDSGYRGEIQATFKKTNWLKGDSSEKYKVGDRIAQIIILPYPRIQFVESNQLSDTDRGNGGFGSTGT